MLFREVGRDGRCRHDRTLTRRNLLAQDIVRQSEMDRTGATCFCQRDRTQHVLLEIGGIAAYLIIVAYRNAPAAVIAPFDYTMMIWATLFGWLFWRETPEPIVVAGAIIIALAGLYVTHRESRSR